MADQAMTNASQPSDYLPPPPPAAAPLAGIPNGVRSPGMFFHRED
jgi:hypothetical protein